jgi:hypothetical protein
VVAAIDVHKRLLAVVVADVTVEGPFRFEGRTVWSATFVNSMRSSPDYCATIRMRPVKTKGSIFEAVYRRLVVRLGHAAGDRSIFDPGSRS